MSRIVRYCRNRYSVWILASLVYLLPLVVVHGAFDAFLKIEGIPGESADAKHKDWIVLDSAQLGVSRTITGTGTGRVLGAMKHSDLVVHKRIDKASPVLFKEVCSGKVFPKVEIDYYRATSATTTYYTITLSDCIISSVGSSGPDSGTPQPTESVSFNYSKIEFRYVEADSATGSTNLETYGSCDNGSGVP